MSQDPEKQQLFQEFLKFKPSLLINSIVSRNDLYNLLNQMCASLSRDTVYDNDSFEELLERISQQYGSLTIGNFIDVHLQATDIIRFRLNQSRTNIAQLTDFISNLQIQIKDLIHIDHLQKEDTGLFVILKKISLLGQIISDSLQIRISNESLNIDQSLPFQNQIGIYFIDLNAQPIAIDSLTQAFQIEIFDDQSHLGVAQLNVFQLSMKDSKEFEIPIAFESKDTMQSLEIEGNLQVKNLQYAREDLIQLQEIHAQMKDDMAGLQEQYQSLNFPFSQVPQIKRPAPRSANQSFNSQQIQGKHHNFQMNQTPTPDGMDPHLNDYYFNQINPDQLKQQQHGQNQRSVNVAAQRPQQAFPGNEENGDYDLSSQELIKKTHLILIIHLVCAVLFCLKRSMFLDVTISVAYLCAILKMDLATDPRGTQISRLFSCFFVFSVILDLVWLVVCFSGWSNSISSDDQGAQNVLRLLLLGGSLLFLVYKLLTAIAVIYLQNSIAINAPIVKQQLLNFLSSESQSNPHMAAPAHIAAPAQQIPVSIIY